MRGCLVCVCCLFVFLVSMSDILKIFCRNKIVVNKYLLSVFGRLFLEKKEKALMKFISDFQKLTVSDEKVSFMAVQFEQNCIIRFSEFPSVKLSFIMFLKELNLISLI